MGIKFTNNALTLLAANLSAANTIVTVVPGTGAGFPAVVGGAGDYFVLTMENAAGQREFIRVDHRVGDTMGSGGFPCVRGYYGSTPLAWAAGDSVDLRWSANTVQDYLSTITGRYLGAFAAAPPTDEFGGAIKLGDLYYDTVLVNMLVWTGAIWKSAIILVEQVHPDGTIAAPGISWMNELNSGWYRAAPNDFWYSVNGVNIFRVTSNGIELAAGKTALNISSFTFVQDAQPPVMQKGEQWFESDVGGYYMRYVNPDSTQTLVALAAAGGDFIPMGMKGAPNGVASLDANGKVPQAQMGSGFITSVTTVATGSHVVPPNAKFAKVTIKAGGGGGGCSATATLGGGGGEGASAWGWQSVIPGQTVQVNIGAGGTAVPINTNASGGNGGPTEWWLNGVLRIVCGGGFGGTQGNFGGAGGQGGITGGGGAVLIFGAVGHAGGAPTGSGPGGSPAGGGLGGAVTGSSAQANSGAGGGGGGPGVASGTGGAGYAVTEYFS